MKATLQIAACLLWSGAALYASAQQPAAAVYKTNGNFTVALSNPAGSTIGAADTATTTIAALEPTGAPEVGVDNDAGGVVDAQRARMSLDARELKAVRGMPRFEVRCFAVRHHGVDLTGAEWFLRLPVNRTQVIRRDVARVVERFAVSDRQRCVAWTEVREPQPAVDVLAEVDDVLVVGEVRHRVRPNDFDAADWRRRRPKNGKIV